MIAFWSACFPWKSAGLIKMAAISFVLVRQWSPYWTPPDQKLRNGVDGGMVWIGNRWFPWWRHLTASMRILYHFFSLMLTGAIVIQTPVWFNNLNNQGETKWILVVVVKWQHRASVLSAWIAIFLLQQSLTIKMAYNRTSIFFLIFNWILLLYDAMNCTTQSSKKDLACRPEVFFLNSKIMTRFFLSM